MFCARLFICALWSPAGKGLTSWLSIVVSSVSLSLSHWYPGSGVVLDCIDSWSLHHYLLLLVITSGRVEFLVPCSWRNWGSLEIGNLCKDECGKNLTTWVKVFRLIPEFRNLRPTFHRKSASKSWIRQILITSFSDLFSVHLWAIDHFNLKFVKTL